MFGRKVAKMRRNEDSAMITVIIDERIRENKED